MLLAALDSNAGLSAAGLLWSFDSLKHPKLALVSFRATTALLRHTRSILSCSDALSPLSFDVDTCFYMASLRLSERTCHVIQRPALPAASLLASLICLLTGHANATAACVLSTSVLCSSVCLRHMVQLHLHG